MNIFNETKNNLIKTILKENPNNILDSIWRSIIVKTGYTTPFSFGCSFKIEGKKTLKHERGFFKPIPNSDKINLIEHVDPGSAKSLLMTNTYENRMRIIEEFLEEMFEFFLQKVLSSVPKSNANPDAEIHSVNLRFGHYEAFSIKRDKNGVFEFLNGNIRYNSYTADTDTFIVEEDLRVILEKKFNKQVYYDKFDIKPKLNGTTQESIDLMQGWNNIIVFEKLGNVSYFQDPDNIKINDGKVSVYSVETKKINNESDFLFVEKYIDILNITSVNSVRDCDISRYATSLRKPKKPKKKNTKTNN